MGRRGIASHFTDWGRSPAGIALQQECAPNQQAAGICHRRWRPRAINVAP